VGRSFAGNGVSSTLFVGVGPAVDAVDSAVLWLGLELICWGLGLGRGLGAGAIGAGFGLNALGFAFEVDL
jgi:hypothetical protein